MHRVIPSKSLMYSEAFGHFKLQLEIFSSRTGVWVDYLFFFFLRYEIAR